MGLGPAELPDFNVSDGLPLVTQSELIAARRGEAALREFIESVDGEALEAWEHLLPPSDRAVLWREDVQREEAQEAEEQGAAGIDGWVDDDLAFFARPWGFFGSDIVAPTMLLYGGSDVLVPVSPGRAWERAITHANLRVIDGGGHWLRDFERDYLNWFAELSAPSRLVDK